MEQHQESGFSLIELLTSITIVGVLASIAIIQVNIYKARSFDARAEHDLRVAITAQEAHFTDNENYVDCADDACEAALESFSLSAGTKITFEIDDVGMTFLGEASHPLGRMIFRFNSADGSYSAVES